MDVNEMRVKKY